MSLIPYDAYLALSDASNNRQLIALPAEILQQLSGESYDIYIALNDSSGNARLLQITFGTVSGVEAITLIVLDQYMTSVDGDNFEITYTQPLADIDLRQVVLSDLRY